MARDPDLAAELIPMSSPPSFIAHGHAAEQGTPTPGGGWRSDPGYSGTVRWHLSGRRATGRVGQPQRAAVEDRQLFDGGVLVVRLTQHHPHVGRAVDHRAERR